MSAKADVVRMEGRRPTASAKRGGDEDDEDKAAQIFISQLDIDNLVSSGLQGKAKKAFESQRIQALGGAAEKKARMPYPMAQRMLKKQRADARAEEDELVASGMLTPKEAKRRRAMRLATEKNGGATPGQRKMPSKYELSTNRGLNPFAVGRFKDGQLKLSKGDIENVRGRGKTGKPGGKGGKRKARKLPI